MIATPSENEVLRSAPSMATTISHPRIPPRAPVWPVMFAPLVAAIYYLAIKLAFAQSIISAMGRTDFFDTPRWGSHWAFRAAAEVIAVGFGTFIAASLAFRRERIAAIVGGCAISCGFIVKLTLMLFDPDQLAAPEPWYQYAIDALMVIGAPSVGIFVADAAQDLRRVAPRGVGGINRFHFIWLWFVVYFYAIGLITPVARLYALSEPNIVGTAITLLINGIPAVAVAIPGYYGMAFLAGHHGDTMYPAGRNMIGVFVLISGLIVGAAVQFGWYWMVQNIYDVIFG
jgi:hypothetical protein